MPDISTTFGFVFSVDDQATPGVERAQAAVEAAADTLENSMVGFLSSAEGIVGGLGSAVGDAAEEIHDLGGEVDQLTNSLSGMSEEWADPLELIAQYEEASKALHDNIREYQLDQEFHEMADAFSELGENLEVVSEHLLNESMTEALESMSESIESMPDDAARTATLVGTLVPTFTAANVGAGKLVGTLGKLAGQGGGGGFMAALLGPIGPLITLLMPLIRILTDTLLPIFEDFIAIIQNAFAPLQFVLDTLLQSLIPHIQKLMGPIVAMLTYLAVDLGVQLQQMFGGLVGLIGPVMQAIVGLMPALQGIFQAIVRVGVKALPMFLDLLIKVVPVFIELAKILAESFITHMDILVDLIDELGPDFVGLVADILKALLPLVKVMVEFTDVILRDALVPVLIPMLKSSLQLLRDILPAVVAILKPVVDLFSYLTEKLAALGENWDKFLKAFPEVEAFLTDSKKAAGEFLEWFADGIMAIPDAVSSIFNTIKGKGSELLDWLGGLGTKAKKLLSFIPFVSFDAASEAGSVPGFADGTIATGEEGVFGQVGEAGTAEAVVPLDRQHIREFMEPALGELSLAGLDEQTGFLSALVELGREALSKMDRDREDRAQAGGGGERYNIEADLSGGIGMSGLIPVGG